MTSAARLARLGYRSPEDVQRLLAGAGAVPEPVVAGLAMGADPDLAVRSFLRIADADEDVSGRLETDSELLSRVAGVLGASQALGDVLARHPGMLDDLDSADLPRDAALRDRMLSAVGADPAADSPVSTDPDAAAVDALRVAYYRQLTRIAALDLAGELDVAAVGVRLADLAAATLDGGLAIARARAGKRAQDVRLAVIAMGKCGGEELNYVSDVDVVFVHATGHGSDDDALKSATQLASQLVQVCSAHTGEGTIWAVDTALRPEGRSGPLVRTVASHLGYYEKWAKTWEFQALVKARPVAGDRALGEEYVQAIAPLVWRASEREGFVPEVQAMRRRVVEHIPTDTIDRQLKLGPGGLRDVEFAVQLLQLVHGRGDEALRQASTLDALAALTDGGYVGREDGAAMARAYRFLRTLEHRIQLYRLQRTHVVPDEESDLRRLGRSMGLRTDPVEELRAEWRRQRREVRRLHEKLFYRPLLDAVAGLPGEGLRLTPDAARQRLTALGYLDPAGALAHLEALTSGVSRSAAIQRQLLPAMLSWFAEAPNPDAGLLAFRTVSERLGSTHWYLRQLRDEGEGAQHLARVLASSRFGTDLLVGAPESVAMLGDEDNLAARTREQLLAETVAAARRHDDATEAIHAVRAVRRRELSRTAIADVLGLVDDVAVGEALTDITIAALSGALIAAVAATESKLGTQLPTRMAIVAMGRLGGRELSYGSDADVMFVHVPRAGVQEEAAHEAALEVARTLRRELAGQGDDPALEVDAGLRPEGKNGPLVRTLSSYAAYYARWSKVWEAQALLRADPVIGDVEVCERFGALIDPLRWPERGLTNDEVGEIRRIKARIDAERLPRGADPATHLKLGRGGLADIEWTVQLLQLRHAHRVEGLRTPGTLGALMAATEAGLLDPDDGQALTAAWRLSSRIRNAIMLARGRPADSLPRDPRERAAVAHLLGYELTDSQRLVDDHLRTSRRARAVVDRVFWE